MNADLRQAVGTGRAAAGVGIEERKGRFHISDFAEARLPLPDRRLRLGMVGGGQGAFIGEIHAMGARLSNCWEVVAGALSSDRERAKASASEWRISADRAYASYAEMAEREATRPDGIDAVAITTPNHLHHAVASAFLANGIDVISDKPLTTTLADAIDLAARTKASGLVFGVTYAFAAYPMVRQAREMVRAGELGRIRQLHVEYVQDWLTNPLPPEHKQAGWRADPVRSGPVGCTGDIGTHAHHLATFVSGLEIERLRAELLVCGSPKALDDTVFVNARYSGNVPGLLWATQVAPGNPCGLRLRIYGERAGLEWDEEQPEFLKFDIFGEPTRLISRGAGAGVGLAATRLTRTPRGHPEGWLEAWANLYIEFAVAIDARRQNRKLPAGLIDYPTVEDGVKGMQFIDAVVRSDRNGGNWVEMPAASEMLST
jgi:predicted dehydrogenase